ncbi:MAG: peptidoglycan-binding protein [Bacteroidota bacterium]
MKKKYHLLLLFMGCVAILTAQKNSRWVYPSEQGCLEYITDEEGNYIPDFSHAGYQSGEKPLPEIATVLTINPIAGDNTIHLQTALDSLGNLPINEAGFRGALQLNAGVYEIHGQVFINQSGVVLRGVGDGVDSTQNTILKGIGDTPEQRDLIVAGNVSVRDWKKSVPNSTTNIVNPFLPVGVRTIELATVTPYAIGDKIIIFQPSTDTWLASINYGDTAEDAPWKMGEIDLYYQRKIVDIVAEENKIVIDAPIFDHLDRALAQSTVYKLDDANMRFNIGVENLRIVIETEGPETENHVKNGIAFKGVENAWARGITVLHFKYAAIYTRAAINVTVTDCRGLVPHSLITGARRYNFDVDAFSNNILFEKCHASYGRHSYVSNGASSASGIVFHDCTSEHDYNASEGHRRWSQGLLFDKITFTEPETRNLVGLYNRGSYGTGHGWSSVHSVAWNINLGSSQNELFLQKPPHRQNYSVGCLALVTNVHRFTHPAGIIDLARKEVVPASLYQAQLTDRLTNGVKPDAPARLKVDFNVLNQTFELTWLDIAAKENGYVLQIAKNTTENFQEIGRVAANISNFSYPLPDSVSGSITFRVATIGEACLSPFSNPVTLEVEKLVNTTEKVIPNVSIIPNPAKDFLQIKGDFSLDSIYAYNLQGIRFYPIVSETNKVDISMLPKGLFYLKLQDTTGQIGIYKFLKL